MGSQTPFLQSMTIHLPSSLQQTITATREIELADPSNPLSILWQRDLLTVNGETHERYFDAALNRIDMFSPMGRRQTTILDTHGRPTRWTRGSLQSVELGYDTLGRLATISEGARSASIGYDARHRPVLFRDPMAREVHLTYDSADRVLT